MEKLYRVQMNSKGAPDFSTAKEVTNLSTKKDCFTCGMGRDEETGYPILLYNPEKVMHEVLDANDRAVSLAEVCKLIEETYEMCPRDWQKLRELPSVDRPTVDKDYLIQLIQEAVYDGEACAKLLDLVDRPQGEWIYAEIPLESGGSMPIQACNLCKTFYPLAYTGGGHRFCPNCGAMMKGADDE